MEKNNLMELKKERIMKENIKPTVAQAKNVGVSAHYKTKTQAHKDADKEYAIGLVLEHGGACQWVHDSLCENGGADIKAVHDIEWISIARRRLEERYVADTGSEEKGKISYSELPDFVQKSFTHTERYDIPFNLENI